MNQIEQNVLSTWIKLRLIIVYLAGVAHFKISVLQMLWSQYGCMTDLLEKKSERFKIISHFSFPYILSEEIHQPNMSALSLNMFISQGFFGSVSHGYTIFFFKQCLYEYFFSCFQCPATPKESFQAICRLHLET